VLDNDEHKAWLITFINLDYIVLHAPQIKLIIVDIVRVTKFNTYLYNNVCKACLIDWLL